MHNMPHTIEAKQKMSASHKGIPLYHKRRPTLLIDGVEYYKCGKCGEFFPREGFYKDTRTLLGLKNECRHCHCQTSIASRDKDKARDGNRTYMRQSRQLNIEKHRQRERNRKRVKDEKYYARMALNCAVKRGQIAKPLSCEECGNEKRLTGHHVDYSKPLEVRWLCYECHGKKHRSDR